MIIGRLSMGRTSGHQPTRAARSVTFCLLGALTALMTLTAMPSAAYADAAVAIGLPSDVATHGISMFVYVNASSTQEAKSRAVAGCKTVGSDTSKALCRVLATFRDRCAAQAFDPKDGTPGFGWAVAETLAEARRQALANCRDTAGPDRQDACIIPEKGFACDGHAK
jgi:hypothetical protein